MSKKQDIEPLNDKGQRHGLCVYYWYNDNIRSKRRFVNGTLHGISEEYWDNGELWYKDYKSKGKEIYIEWYTRIE